MKNKKYTYKCTNGEYIESKFELGDVVKVTSFGSTYTSYFDAFKAMNVSGNDIINDGMGHYKLRTFNYEEFEEYKNDNSRGMLSGQRTDQAVILILRYMTQHAWGFARSADLGVVPQAC